MKIYIVLFFYGITLLFYSCSEDPASSNQQQGASAITQDGWGKYFQAGLYSEALAKFITAIEEDATYADAYDGAGWASARLSQLENAVNYFNDCLEIDDSIVDACGGLAFTYYAQKEYESAIAFSNQALNKKSNWVFTYDKSISYKDIHLVIAGSYYVLKDYSNALSHVKKLNASFYADINTEEGKAQLAQEIERLNKIM